MAATYTNTQLTKKRWMVLISSCIINLCIGAMYAWSVFAPPMAEYLSGLKGAALTAADLAIVFSIGNSSGFITMIGGGFLTNKLGPKWVIFIGGVLFGLGFVVCSLATGIGTLIIGYGLLSGLAMGLAYGCTISNSVKFFPDKKGLIGGIATASYGISSVIIPPIANALISRVGVCRSFLTVGIVIIAAVGVFSQFIIKCPAGFTPDGWKPVEKKADTATAEKRETDFKGMLSMPLFYLMIIMLFFGASLGMMAISQASSIAQKMIGMSAASAAIIVSVLALFNTFGRILAGVISDRIGCINTLTGVFVIAIAAMLLLYFSSNAVIFAIGICLIGICFGAFMGVYPSFTAGQFGIKNSGVNYGIMFIGFNLAGLLGPIFVSNIFKSSGTYRPSFILGAAFAAVGLALSILIRNKRFKMQ